jgi:hypothetical protein
MTCLICKNYLSYLIQYHLIEVGLDVIGLEWKRQENKTLSYLLFDAHWSGLDNYYSILHLTSTGHDKKKIPLQERWYPYIFIMCINIKIII